MAGTSLAPAWARVDSPNAGFEASQQGVVVVGGVVGEGVVAFVGDHDRGDVSATRVGSTAPVPGWPESEKSSSSQVTTIALRPCCHVRRGHDLLHGGTDVGVPSRDQRVGVGAAAVPCMS